MAHTHAGTSLVERAALAAERLERVRGRRGELGYLRNRVRDLEAHVRGLTAANADLRRAGARVPVAVVRPEADRAVADLEDRIVWLEARLAQYLAITRPSTVTR